MGKKLMMSCMAIAAIAAIVIAPTASASPVLTESGKAVAVGASVKWTNTGVTKFTASGFNVECSNDVLSGTVTQNNGTQIKGEIPVGSASFHGSGTGSGCTSSLGVVHWTISSKTCYATGSSIPPFTVIITGCTGNLIIIIEITGLGQCKYSAASISGTMPGNADSTINISEQSMAKTEGGVFCPASGKLDMDFDLTTTDGTTLATS